MGYAMVFVGLSNRVAEVGIAPALVQMEALTERCVRTGFTISLALGALAFATLWILAPMITSETAAPMLRVLAGIFVIQAPAMVSGALLQRRMEFSRLSVAEVVSYVSGYGFVAITLAVHKCGAWSLAWGMITQSVLRTGTLLIMAPYPMIPQLGVLEARKLVRFGVGMGLARAANYAAGNLDYLAVGRGLGDYALGLYQRSFQLSAMPAGRMAGILTSVLFPALSRIQDDPARLRQAYLTSVSATALVCAPVMTFIALSSMEIVTVLYGNAWRGCAPSLAILSVNSVFISVFTLADAVARAKGLVYQQSFRHSAHAVLVLLFALIGSRQSIEAVAVGVTAATFCMYVMMARFALKMTGASLSEFLSRQAGGAMLAVAVCVGAIPPGLFAEGLSVTAPLASAGAKLVGAVIVLVLVMTLCPQSWLGPDGYRIIGQLSARFRWVRGARQRVQRVLARSELRGLR